MRKNFPSFQSIPTNGWQASIQRMREQAFDAFQNMPFPTTHDEDWRFTNLAPYLKIPFRNATEGTAAPVREVDFARSDEMHHIVFINGRFAKQLSTVSDQMFAGSVKDAPRDLNWQSLAGTIIAPDKNAFTAWNTAFFNDIALIHVPDKVVVEKPVRVTFVQTAGEDVISLPRLLVVLGKQSQLQMIESYQTQWNGRYFTNAVTEISLGEGAILQHIKIQQDSAKSLHIATSHTVQDRDSSYTSLAMTLGAELSREHLRVTLDGAGGDCTLNGLYLIGENQHCDHHTTIDHAKPHSTSRELYKGILSGKSRAIFNGKIIVRKDAQKTDAEQTNKNLLLTQTARINTIPQLEILADDVKCRHGATIGHLDEDALFYLRSRGIADHVARTMLMKGFVQDVTGRIPEENVRTFLDNLVSSRLMEFTGVAS